ncbi:hypothetical protein RJ639_023315 [Escallonia herrerae]|uniref:Uncharacterized protein n=1 Tax=Escallonia herrerae TaxID=1293975 RepID=A0AA89ADP1_9ASTE|nr:hypothetical protein RJ639_023315 [Escallonia herrerae]
MGSSVEAGLMAVFAVSGSVALLALQVHKRLLSDFMKKIEFEMGSRKVQKKKKVRFAEHQVTIPPSVHEDYYANKMQTTKPLVLNARKHVAEKGKLDGAMPLNWQALYKGLIAYRKQSINFQKLKLISQMDEDFLQLSMIFNTTKSVVLVPNRDPKFKIAVLASKQCNNFTVKASVREADCYGRSHFEDLSCQELDRLENNSRTIKGAKIIGQDNEALSVVGCLDDTSRRVMYESSACITAILSQVAQGLIVPVQLLSTKMLYVFPLHAFRSHSLLPLDIRDHDLHSLVGTGSTKVVDAVTGAFLKSKGIQVAIYYCFHQRFEAVVCVGTQIGLNIYGCTIDDKVCEHHKDWRPERFLDENKDSVDPYKMTAFGGGKRVWAGALQTMPISCMAVGKFIQESES